LALVKSLAVLHGGRVEAHSEGLGRGSEFVVYLPCLAEAPTPGAPRSESRSHGTRGLKVLVVDDNVDAAQRLATLLEMNGYEVGVAYDGKSALASALPGQADVALID